MSAPVQKTLGQLMVRLARRLGYGAQGDSYALQQGILADFLQDSQEQLLLQFKDILTRQIDESVNTAQGQTLYDIPTAADPHRFNSIGIKIADQWSKLRRGVHLVDRNFTEQQQPFAWDFRYGTTEQGQIEILPEPDQAYPLLMDYYLRGLPFTDPEDEGHKSTINSNLIFLYAMWLAKSHYSHKDAPLYEGWVNGVLRRLKAARHLGRSYSMRRGDFMRSLQHPHIHKYSEVAGETLIDFDALIGESGAFLTGESGAYLVPE